MIDTLLEDIETFFKLTDLIGVTGEYERSALLGAIADGDQVSADMVLNDIAQSLEYEVDRHPCPAWCDSALSALDRIIFPAVKHRIALKNTQVYFTNLGPYFIGCDPADIHYVDFSLE